MDLLTTSSQRPQTHTSTESRALSLLGQGIGPEMVASAIGVSVSRISQLLSDSEFSKEVLELRYQNLAKHNVRDSKVDDIEDLLLDKIQDLLPFMVKPLEVIRAYSLINAAKRRGSSTPDSIVNKQQIVQLIMPSTIINQYSTNTKIETNIHNQVIKTGDRDLITVQSGQMTKLLTQRDQNVSNNSSTAKSIGES